MDNLTHTCTGLFLSRAGLNRFTSHATPILLLAANAPDADAVSLLGGAIGFFKYHRYLTHSLLFLPVMAALALLVVRVAVRKPFPLLPAYLVALIGVCSHLLLDLTNAFGVRLLLPFSGHWYRWDLSNVVDFWVWSVFFFCLAAPLLSRLVGGEIGAPAKSRYPGRGFAVFALLFVLFYDGARWVLHARVLAALDARIYDGAAPTRVAAFPPGSNPLHWKAIAQIPSGYRLFDFDLAQPFDPTAGTAVPILATSPAMQAASLTEPFRLFLNFSSFPYWRTVPASSPDGGTIVFLGDLRYPFFARAIVAADNTVASSIFSFGE